jgi:hypothetical protein
VGVICTKKQEATNIKTCYEFGTNAMKMSFKHKTRMKFNHKIKEIYIYIYIYNVNL